MKIFSVCLGQRHHLLFPLEGKCRAAAKGCTRLHVEKKRKGCPDRQTAACFWRMPLAVLAIEHPRATLWPSPPQGGARFSGTIPCFPLRGNAALAAKGCTRLRVEMKRKGCPDRQTAACLGGVSFEVLAVQHPRATTWPSPPQGGARFSGALCSCHLKGAQGSEAFFPRVKSQPVLQDAVNIFLYLNEMKGNVTIGVANHKNS